MRKFLYEFIRNLVSFIVILGICGILLFILVFSCVTGKTNLILWACGVVVILISLIPTIITVFEPEKYINRFSKWITRYEDDEKKLI